MYAELQGEEVPEPHRGVRSHRTQATSSQENTKTRAEPFGAGSCRPEGSSRAGQSRPLQTRSRRQARPRIAYRHASSRTARRRCAAGSPARNVILAPRAHDSTHGWSVSGISTSETLPRSPQTSGRRTGPCTASLNRDPHSSPARSATRTPPGSRGQMGSSPTTHCATPHSADDNRRLLAATPRATRDRGGQGSSRHSRPMT